VAHIDGYGNCITNIHRRDFEGAGTGRPFVIRQRMVRMEIRKLHASYEDVAPGERVALFNRAGYLEIAINCHSVPGGKGGADSLLGLSHGTPVRVEFEG
jgi:S-adenosylmethionine hydrolase